MRICKVCGSIRFDGDSGPPVEFARFLRAWLNSGQPERSAGDLVELAVAYGVELRGETTHAIATSLGRLLSRYEKQEILVDDELLLIRRSRFLHGYYWWRVEKRPPMSTQPLYSEVEPG